MKKCEKSCFFILFLIDFQKKSKVEKGGRNRKRERRFFVFSFYLTKNDEIDIISMLF